MIKNWPIIFLALTFLLNTVKAQEPENHFYVDAYQTLDNMLNKKQQYSFKEAVFNVENAYY